MHNKTFNLINTYLDNKKIIDWMVIRSEIILSEQYQFTFEAFKNIEKDKKNHQFELTYYPDSYFITFYASNSLISLPILFAFAPDFFDHPLQVLKYAIAVFYGFGTKYGDISILTQAFTEDQLINITTKIFNQYGLDINPDYRKELLYYEYNNE